MQIDLLGRRPPSPYRAAVEQLAAFAASANSANDIAEQALKQFDAGQAIVDKLDLGAKAAQQVGKDLKFQADIKRLLVLKLDALAAAASGDIRRAKAIAKELAGIGKELRGMVGSGSGGLGASGGSASDGGGFVGGGVAGGADSTAVDIGGSATANSGGGGSVVTSSDSQSTTYGSDGGYVTTEHSFTGIGPVAGLYGKFVDTQSTVSESIDAKTGAVTDSSRTETTEGLGGQGLELRGTVVAQSVTRAGDHLSYQSSMTVSDLSFGGRTNTESSVDMEVDLAAGTATLTRTNKAGAEADQFVAVPGGYQQSPVATANAEATSTITIALDGRTPEAVFAAETATMATAQAGAAVTNSSSANSSTANSSTASGRGAIAEAGLTGAAAAITGTSAMPAGMGNITGPDAQVSAVAGTSTVTSSDSAGPAAAGDPMAKDVEAALAFIRKLLLFLRRAFAKGRPADTNELNQLVRQLTATTDPSMGSAGSTGSAASTAQPSGGVVNVTA